MVIIRTPPANKRTVIRAPAPQDPAPFEWTPLGSIGASSRSPQRAPAIPPASASLLSPQAPASSDRQGSAPEATASAPKDKGSEYNSPPERRIAPRHVDNRPLPTLARTLPVDLDSDQPKESSFLGYTDTLPSPTQRLERNAQPQERLPSLGSIAAATKARHPPQARHERSSPEKTLHASGLSSSSRPRPESRSPSNFSALLGSTAVSQSSAPSRSTQTLLAKREVTPASAEDNGDSSIVVHTEEIPSQPNPNSVKKEVATPINQTAPQHGSMSSNESNKASAFRRTPGTAHRLEPSARSARVEAHELADLRRRVLFLEKEKQDLCEARDRLKEDCDGWESEVARLESDLNASLASQVKARTQNAVTLSASRMATAHSNVKILVAANDAREADVARIGAENRASYTQFRMDELYMLLEQERKQADDRVNRVRFEARMAVKAERTKAKQSSATIQAQEKKDIVELTEQADNLGDQVERYQRAEKDWKHKVDSQQKNLDELKKQVKKLEAEAKARPTYHDSDGPRFIDTSSTPARPLDWRQHSPNPEEYEKGGKSAASKAALADNPPGRNPKSRPVPRPAPRAAASKARGPRGKKRNSDEHEEEGGGEEAPITHSEPSTKAGKSASSSDKPSARRNAKTQSVTERAAEAFALEVEKSVVLPGLLRGQSTGPQEESREDADPVPEPDEPQAVPRLPAKKKKRRLLGGGATLGSQYLSSDLGGGSSFLPLEMSPVKPTESRTRGKTGLPGR